MNQRKEAFRGVVWPREAQDDLQGKPVYRYVIVGMLVTDKPIEGLHSNETVLDGVINLHDGENGIGDVLAKAGKFLPAYPVGDATSVLLGLSDIVGKPFKKKKSR